MYTCEPELSTQFMRGKTFAKPAEFLQILNIFGPTLTGAGDQEARLYTKIIAPFFNNRTMYQVWTSSIDAAGLLERELLWGRSGLPRRIEISRTNSTKPQFELC